METIIRMTQKGKEELFDVLRRNLRPNICPETVEDVGRYWEGRFIDAALMEERNILEQDYFSFELRDTETKDRRTMTASFGADAFEWQEA